MACGNGPVPQANRNGAQSAIPCFLAEADLIFAISGVLEKCSP